MEKKRFEEILSRFASTKVAVLGDFFLDLYIQMERSLSELSLETHKEAFQAVDLRGQPGAAGVVTNNLSALGAQSAAISFIGTDGNGYTLRQALQGRNVITQYLVETDKRFTPTYTKPMMHEVDGRDVELNRIDIINRSPNPHAINAALAENIKQAIQAFDGILIVEQVKEDGYGTMSPLLRGLLSEIAEKHPEKPIVVDSRHFASAYNQVSLKMNLSEAVNAVSNIDAQHPALSEHDPIKAASSCAAFFWRRNKKPVFITLGEKGITGFTESGFFHYPGYKVEGPIDIVGAGDSVLAGAGLALCAGADPQEAAYIGNLVGSITIQLLGTTSIATQEDLFQRQEEYEIQIKE